MPFSKAIASLRDAVCAVLRIRRLQENQLNIGIVGTAWCFVDNRYFLTAHHVFNEGKPRDPDDRFYLFSVPQNGPRAFHAPVVSFPQEDQSCDMAVIEIDAEQTPGFNTTAVPVTFRDHQDGEKVLTYGFPAPGISNARVDRNLNWNGGHMFLKSHANEGIISGQFDLDGKLMFELNVGWYQGESGGPIFSLEPLAAFSMMQRYRDVQTVHGVVPGPHQGYSLREIGNTLQQLGAHVI